MKYIITTDIEKLITLDNISVASSYVFTNRNEANTKWKEIKNREYFEYISTHTVEDVVVRCLSLYQTKQFTRPIFASIETSFDLSRLFTKAYGDCIVEQYKFALPKIPFEKMEFNIIMELDISKYNEKFHRAYVVREKSLDTKLIISERFVKYDEMLYGRENVCEVRLHPYCSDFTLVKDVELGYYDYDM